MDMVEWDIKTTSDKCPHLVCVYNGDDTVVGYECDHWDNPTKACKKEYCSILIKEKCRACQGKGFLLAPDNVADTCTYCNGVGEK